MRRKILVADADIARVIAQGAPGTLMASWARALTDAEVADLVALARSGPSPTHRGRSSHRPTRR